MTLPIKEKRGYCIHCFSPFVYQLSKFAKSLDQTLGVLEYGSIFSMYINTNKASVRRERGCCSFVPRHDIFVVVMKAWGFSWQFRVRASASQLETTSSKARIQFKYLIQRLSGCQECLGSQQHHTICPFRFQTERYPAHPEPDESPDLELINTVQYCTVQYRNSNSPKSNTSVERFLYP